MSINPSVDLQKQAAAIIMAGGMSSRMKQDKRLLPIDGKPMLEHLLSQLEGRFAQILISADSVPIPLADGALLVPDKRAGQGPLMGLASALERSSCELNLVVACDIPNVDMMLVRRLFENAAGYDIVVPRSEEGRLEPLFALYRKNVAAAANALLASGERRVSSLFDQARVKYLDLPEAMTIRNINTMRDYLEYTRKGPESA